jgi:hypothetical protein
MNHIHNITLSELIHLEDKSQYEVLRYVKPISIWNKKKAVVFEELTFGQVVEIRQILEDTTIENITKPFQWVFGLSEKEVMKLKVLDFYGLLNHIIKETERIQLMEESLSEPDPLWQNAGGSKLAQYGEFGVMMSIAEQFNMWVEDVEEKKYGIVFMIMSWNKDLNKVRTEYQRLMNRKNQS